MNSSQLHIIHSDTNGFGEDLCGHTLVPQILNTSDLLVEPFLELVVVNTSDIYIER